MWKIHLIFFCLIVVKGCKSQRILCLSWCQCDRENVSMDCFLCLPLASHPGTLLRFQKPSMFVSKMGTMSIWISQSYCARHWEGGICFPGARVWFRSLGHSCLMFLITTWVPCWRFKHSVEGKPPKRHRGSPACSSATDTSWGEDIGSRSGGHMADRMPYW